jgi:hypothetical protein
LEEYNNKLYNEIEKKVAINQKGDFMIERTKYLNQLINTKNNGFPKGTVFPLVGFLGAKPLNRSPQRAKSLIGTAVPPEKRSEKVNFEAASFKRENPCKRGIF